MPSWEDRAIDRIDAEREREQGWYPESGRPVRTLSALTTEPITLGTDRHSGSSMRSVDHRRRKMR